MIENEKLVKARKKNMKLYPFYRAFASDIIFLYAIKLLFLTEVRGVSVSDVIFSVSMYALFMVFLQIPAMVVIQKIGYRRSAFLSNLFNIFYVGILMFSSNVVHLCIAEFMSALTFSLKDVAEPSLLSASIPKTEKRGKIYSKLEGKGKAHYYYIDAITAVLSGFMYAVNPYLPLIFAIVVSVFACLLSLLFEEIKEEEKRDSINVKEYIGQLQKSFTFILKSKRLKSLLLYSGITWGFMCIMADYRTSILQDINTPAQIIGIMSAIFGIVSGIASKKQVEFHNMFRNHSLSVIMISCATAMVLSGAIVLIKAPVWLCIAIILILGFVGKIDNAMNNILTNRYLGNFSSGEMTSNIYATNSIARNIFRMIIGMMGSWLIGVVPSANAMFYAGGVFLLISIILMLYMKPRVGLKPEEYKPEEIEMKV
ncbi:MAG: MFS transporter [Clostridia bacterium]|nr:MFS transporter [Clostridia bacterium]